MEVINLPDILAAHGFDPSMTPREVGREAYRRGFQYGLGPYSATPLCAEEFKIGYMGGLHDVVQA